MNEKLLEKNKTKLAKLVQSFLVRKGVLNGYEIAQIEIRVIERVVCSVASKNNMAVPTEIDAIFSMLITDLDFQEQRVRILNTMDNACVTTVGQLCRKKTPEVLLNYRNFGKNGLRSLVASLKSCGVSLGLHSDCLPGPLEVVQLKNQEIGILLFSEHSRGLLRERGCTTIRSLFPRSDMEKLLDRDAVLRLDTPRKSAIIVEIAGALRREGIPWT